MREIEPSVAPQALAQAGVAAEFRALLASGARLLPAGDAKCQPEQLLVPRYMPRYRIDLFGLRFYLSRPRKNPSVRYFIAYLMREGRREIYPRIFYKDLSLIWRCASHLVANADEFWIGKGAVRTFQRNGYDHFESAEATTDLPLEIQTAVEDINRSQTQVVQDERPLFLVLRNGPPGRVAPYRDFTAPREAAAARGERIYGNRSIATFGRRNDPASLRFVKGFEPDMRGGLLEIGRSSSKLYGGVIERYRLLSTNRKVQYLFMAGPEHVWIVPPQATSRELSTFGVRVVDVHAHDDLFVPGFEYHYLEDDVDPPVWVSQIPPGFVGPAAEFDPTRADARPWLDRLPIVREFRRRVLARHRKNRSRLK